MQTPEYRAAFVDLLETKGISRNLRITESFELEGSFKGSSSPTPPLQGHLQLHQVGSFLLLSFTFYLGDYNDQTLALWSTYTYELLSSTRISEPVHDVAFSPFSHREMACVGKGAIMFWLLEQHGADINLKVNLSFIIY